MRVKTVSKMLVSLTGCFCFAGGAGVIPEDAYVLSVPRGETRRLTAQDVAAFAGRDLVKSGEGTVEGDAVMKSFAGTLYITNGIWRVCDVYGCGTNNVSVFGSGTLWLSNGAKEGWNGGRGVPAMELEGVFRFEGEGYLGGGAISNTADCAMLARNAEMTGDAVISSELNNYFQFRYGRFDMGGYRLTYRGSGGVEAAELGFVSSKNIPLNQGGLDITGGLEYQDWTTSGSPNHTVTLRTGAILKLRQARAPIDSPLTVEEGVRVAVEKDSDTATAGTLNGNQWRGPVTLQGSCEYRVVPDARLAFSGVVSGAGGFTGGQGGWLQLANTANTFLGGVSALGPATGELAGGLALFGNGCVPVAGGAITIGNSSLYLYAPESYSLRQLTYTLPALVATGPALVTNMASRLGSHTLASLKKTGSGVLTLAGPFEILGDAEVQSGTLRFGTRVPQAASGLMWRQRFNGDVSGAGSADTIDPEGVFYAYHAWPNAKALYDNYESEHWYDGYIRIPGEDGETVSCNFVSSMMREAKIVIDGTVVSHVKDNKDVLAGTTIGYKRFSVNKPTVIRSGWRPISVYLHNWYDASCGPAANEGRGWVANFGLGVDWQGRCETNSSHYVKLLDPGDGSFLRPFPEEKPALDPVHYRPVFRGRVVVGAGAALDLGDAVPHTPVVLPSLTGLPTVMNGTLAVKGSQWTVRARDLTVGVPLTVASGAAVSFADGMELVIDLEGLDEKELARAISGRTPLIRVADGGQLSNRPMLRRPGAFWRLEVSADGTAADLVYAPGFSVMVR